MAEDGAPAFEPYDNEWLQVLMFLHVSVLFPFLQIIDVMV